MSDLSAFMPVYIERLEEKLNTLEGAHSALQAEDLQLRQMVTTAQADAAQWQDTCARLVQAIRQIVDESKGAGPSPRLGLPAAEQSTPQAPTDWFANRDGAVSDERITDLFGPAAVTREPRAIVPAATAAVAPGGPDLLDAYLTRLIDEVARLSRERRAAASSDESSVALGAASEAVWGEDVDPMTGPWIEVAYEDVTSELEDTTEEQAAADPARGADDRTAARLAEERVAEDDFPRTGERRTTFDVVVYPFTRFSALRAFEKAIRALPGTRKARLSHFGQVAVQFRVKYEGRIPLAEALGSLRGFKGTVSVDAPDRLVLSLDASARGRAA